mmetsp:Transcript_10555/g.64862  ORF Transcript_10555/g.64862 Transcript_10555/m.64862 type:complete len:241 (-) Transcript_10555:1071-1793(-)
MASGKDGHDVEDRSNTSTNRPKARRVKTRDPTKRAVFHPQDQRRCTAPRDCSSIERSWYETTPFVTACHAPLPSTSVGPHSALTKETPVCSGRPTTNTRLVCKSTGASAEEKSSAQTKCKPCAPSSKEGTALTSNLSCPERTADRVSVMTCEHLVCPLKISTRLQKSNRSPRTLKGTKTFLEVLASIRTPDQEDGSLAVATLIFSVGTIRATVAITGLGATAEIFSAERWRKHSFTIDWR